MTRDERLEADLRRALEARSATACPEEDALLDFYRRRLSEAESESVREHLAACAACVALARDARAFVESMGEPPAGGMPMARAYVWLAAAAVLTAAAIAAIWIARHRPAPNLAAIRRDAPVAPRSNPWKDLTVSAPPFPAAPEDELVFRSDELTDVSFSSAMTSYTRGDYAAAEADLGRFLAGHPGDARALFYRGVSLLLLGRSDEAIAPLESAASSAPAPDGARWFLALARLKSGDCAAALRDLDSVAAAPGAHRTEARSLAEEVRHALDDRGR